MFSVDLKGKTAWVTGGSRGIGRAAALALAQAGADVAIGFRSKEREAEEVAALIRQQGARAVAVQMTVEDASSCVLAHQKVSEALGPVDILVNNAAIIRDNLFVMLEEDDWKSVLDTNVMGVVHCAKVVVRDMMMKRDGRIINISSAAATKGGRGQSNYAASKGAVEALSRSLAVELARRGITVNCLAPGVIETDMSAEVRRLAEEEILERQLVKRFGRPDEVAAWVVFLASSHAGFMTGEVIHIDGGLKMP